MSDAMRLAAHPNLEQYRKLAKELRDAAEAGGTEAAAAWVARWAEQSARREGRSAEAAETEGVLREWRRCGRAEEEGTRLTLARAQFFLARVHGFASWGKFAAHVRALESGGGAEPAFERAADAVVSGDAGRLRELLGRDPELARARSARSHGATLLHYVSANKITRS